MVFMINKTNFLYDFHRNFVKQSKIILFFIFILIITMNLHLAYINMKIKNLKEKNAH